MRSLLCTFVECGVLCVVIVVVCLLRMVSAGTCNHVRASCGDELKLGCASDVYARSVALLNFAIGALNVWFAIFCNLPRVVYVLVAFSVCCCPLCGVRPFAR